MYVPIFFSFITRKIIIHLKDSIRNNSTALAVVAVLNE